MWDDRVKDDNPYKRDLPKRIELINWVLENMKNPDIQICALIETKMAFSRLIGARASVMCRYSRSLLILLCAIETDYDTSLLALCLSVTKPTKPIKLIGSFYERLKY